MNRLGVDRMAELLEKARDVRVLVVGDLMLDRYISGRVGRISPEAPVPVVHVEEDSSAVGGAANVAANVVALGAVCALVGCVGDDEAGRELASELSRLGVDLNGLVTTPDRPTTVKTRVMARHQQIVRVDREEVGDIDRQTASRVAETARGLSGSCSAVAMEDYNKGVLVPSVLRAVLDAAKDANIPSVVDPKRQRFFDYSAVTVFKPNAKELEDALGEPLRRMTGRGWSRYARGWGAHTCCSRWASMAWRFSRKATTPCFCRRRPAPCMMSREQGTRSRRCWPCVLRQVVRWWKPPFWPITPRLWKWRRPVWLRSHQTRSSRTQRRF